MKINRKEKCGKRKLFSYIIFYCAFVGGFYGKLKGNQMMQDMNEVNSEGR